MDKFFKFSQNTKGILSVIGGLFLHLVLGASYSFGLLSPYLLSYLRQYNSNIVIDDGFFIYPILVISQCFTMTVGGWIEKKWGPRHAMICGGIFIMTGYVIFYFTQIIYVVFICAFMIGFGTGLCYLSPIRNGCYYFPSYKGLVIGLIVGGFGFSSSLLSILIKEIINPNGIKAEKNGFYSEEVYSNVPQYILLLVELFGSLLVLSIIFVQPFKSQNILLNDEKLSIEDKEVPESSNLNQKFLTKNKENVNLTSSKDENFDAKIASYPENDREINKNSTSQSKQENNALDQTIKPVNLRYAIFSKVNILFFALGLFSYYLPVVILNTLKTFTNNFSDVLDDNYVFWLSFVLYLGNGVFRMIWGYLYDKLGFKKLIGINFIIIIVVSSSFYFIIEIKALAMIYCLITSALAGAPFTLLPAVIQEIFGVKYSSEIYGGTFYCFGVSAFIGPVLSKLLDLSHSKNTIPYLIIYLFGGVFGILGLILTFFVKMVPYVYRDEYLS